MQSQTPTLLESLKEAEIEIKNYHNIRERVGVKADRKKRADMTEAFACIERANKLYEEAIKIESIEAELSQAYFEYGQFLRSYGALLYPKLTNHSSLYVFYLKMASQAGYQPASDLLVRDYFDQCNNPALLDCYDIVYQYHPSESLMQMLKKQKNYFANYVSVCFFLDLVSEGNIEESKNVLDFIFKTYEIFSKESEDNPHPRVREISFLLTKKLLEFTSSYKLDGNRISEFAGLNCIKKEFSLITDFVKQSEFIQMLKSYKLPVLRNIIRDLIDQYIENWSSLYSGSSLLVSLPEIKSEIENTKRKNIDERINDKCSEWIALISYAASQEEDNRKKIKEGKDFALQAFYNFPKKPVQDQNKNQMPSRTSSFSNLFLFSKKPNKQAKIALFNFLDQEHISSECAKETLKEIFSLHYQSPSLQKDIEKQLKNRIENDCRFRYFLVHLLVHCQEFINSLREINFELVRKLSKLEGLSILLPESIESDKENRIVTADDEIENLIDVIDEESEPFEEINIEKNGSPQVQERAMSSEILRKSK